MYDIEAKKHQDGGLTDLGHPSLLLIIIITIIMISIFINSSSKCKLLWRDKSSVPDDWSQSSGLLHIVFFCGLTLAHAFDQ